MSIFPPPGPPLPKFRTILLKGKYHASAPIHICLSYALSPEVDKVVLIAPSRSALKTDVEKAKDDWIAVHGGEGLTSGAALKVDVLSVCSLAQEDAYSLELLDILRRRLI